MTLRWTQEVARSVATGEPAAVVEEHLDTLLLWLSNAGHASVAPLDAAIAKRGLNASEAKQRAYRLLDLLLFADQGPPSPDLLCLPPSAEANEVKRRYRRLMQVYHPDHHPTRSAWATQRTERINRAFDTYRRGIKPKQRPRAASTARRAASADLPPALTALWDRLEGMLREGITWTRRALSGEQRLRNRLIAGLLAIGMLAILLAAVTREKPPKQIRTSVHETIRVLPTLGRAPTKRVEPEQDKDEAELTSTHWNEPPPEEAVEEKQAVTVLAGEPAPIALPPKPEKDRLAQEASPQKADTPPTTEPPAHAPEAIDNPPPAAAQPTPIPAPAAAQPVQKSGGPRPPTSPLPSGSAQQPSTGSAPLAEPMVPLQPQQSIPPAPSPRRPEPPTPPAPPPPAGTTLMTAPNGTASSNLSIDCRPVRGILARFAQAYEAGALDDLMALYSPLAKENELATWFAIRQTYASWFSKTSVRRIALDRLRVQPTEKGDRCAAMAVFQVNYLDAQSSLSNQGGVIQFLFERRGPNLLILRVRY